MYYGPDILEKAGFGNPENPNETLIDSLPLAAINALGTLIAVFYTDKLGRRYIILRTVPFVGISLLVTALGLGLHNYSSETSISYSTYILFHLHL